MIMWRTARDDLDSERVRMILAIETSCDDTCAAVVTATARSART